ncbi:MAG TPA: MFS transporter [Candidatus Lustribacter sp.]|nr:MFS transporter [Candidatus Lustribacter sp.]
MTLAERVRRLQVDTSPLRTSHDFRILFWAGTVFYLGSMVSYVALPFQLYQLTGSNLVVGAVGAVELVPLVVFGLWGGALADHGDRRSMLIWTGVAQAALTGVLVANALLTNPRIWVIFVVAALLSAAQSLQRPSREALLPRTVSHDRLTAAVALSSLGLQTGMLAGPALGGLLLAHVGIGWCYAVDVTGLVVATGLFVRLGHYPVANRQSAPGLRSISDGIGYAARRRDLLGTYVVDLVAMFMAMPTVLYPAFAQTVLNTPSALGLLYSAGTVGSLLATATSGWASRVHHHGRAVVLAAAAWGGAVALMGIAPSMWLAVFWGVVAGGADMVSALFRATLWNQTIPDSMRGRLAGIEMLSYSLGPLGGQVRAGLVADRTSVRASITSGGLLCVLGVALSAAWLRGFWGYDARTDEHAVRERRLREQAQSGYDL